MTSFEPCGRAPIGVVTNCAAMDCEGQGCAMDKPQVPVSLEDLRAGPATAGALAARLNAVRDLCLSELRNGGLLDPHHMLGTMDGPTFAGFVRCPSCEHRAEFHQPDGCWYSITDAKPGTTVGCNCIGWVPPN